MADRKRRKRMVTRADSARKYANVDLMIVLKEWSNSAPFVGFVRRTRSTLLEVPFGGQQQLVTLIMRQPELCGKSE
jgi:hypothetical protein